MRRERGIALLAAIVIFAIAAAIAVGIQFRSGMAMRRAAGVAAIDQAFQAQAGAEAVAADFLAQDRNQFDDWYRDTWHTPVGPVEIVEGVAVSAQLTDLDGRFNLNSVVDDQGVKDPVAGEILQRLMHNLDIQQQKADLVVDYVDKDQQQEPNGAEDSRYTSLQPPYRPPNRPMTSVSELLAMPGFEPEDYVKLAPHVTALPRDQQSINLCTASGALLDALLNQRLWSQNAQTLDKQRKSGCYPDKAQFGQLFVGAPADRQKIERRVKEQSNFFELRSLVTIAGQPFGMTSLLHRTSGGPQPEVRVVTRAMAE